MYYALIVIIILLGGCSTMGLPGKDWWSYNPANYQGITVVEYKQDGVTIRWLDAKDKAVVKMTGDINSDGNVDVTYDATDIVGSDAAAIRAQVEEVFSNNAAEVTPEVINAIVESLSRM